MDGLPLDISDIVGEVVAGPVVAIIKKVVMKFDADKSSAVTPEEFEKAAESLFSKFDTESGTVSVAELRKLPLRIL